MTDHTLHGLTAEFINALVVGSVEDVFLVRRLNHADLAVMVHEETADREQEQPRLPYRIDSSP